MKRAIVLGGTSPHVELIKKLKQRNYYVILVDYLSNSPGIAVADQHIQESTLDKEKVLEIAIKEKVDLVISTCIDQANSVCCYVAEKLGLPIPYSYQTSLDVTDKGRMKKIMAEADIPTSSYVVVDSVENIDWDKVAYPAVVKPVDCNSSKGVHRADTPEEIIRYVAEDLDYSRAHQAIIEGYNSGEEIQVDCFAAEQSAKVLMTRQKKRINGQNKMVLQSTGSIIPAPLDESLSAQAEEIAVKIARAFHLENTPFFYQAIVTGNGISVLEFAPRIGGGLSYYLLKEVAGVDAVDAAINSFLGIRTEVCGHDINKIYSTNLLYVEPGVFKSIEGLEELKENHIIEEWFQTKESGTMIDDDIRSGNRVGAFIVKGESYKDTAQKELIVYNNIAVLNGEGKDVLKKYLY